jgi:hypothetical protein
MGYFEGLADASFKEDSNGNSVFYPWGVLGKGRILPDEATKTKLRNFIIRYYQVSLPLIIVLVVVRLWWLGVLLAPASFLWFFFQSKKITKDCQISTEKLSVKESYRNSAKSHNKIMLWLLLLISLFFVFSGVYLFIKGKLFIGLSTVIFFGLCSAVFIFMLKIKGK